MAAPTLRVFISYRRKDSIGIAGRIRDRLSSAFGGENVYFDVHSIPYGVDFRQHIDTMVAECDVLLVVIGRQWLDVTDEAGARRLDNPADFVRLEVAAGLRRGIPVIPILVDSASVPEASRLPESIADLAHRNGTPVRHDPDFHGDMDRLISQLSLDDVLRRPPRAPSRYMYMGATAIDRAEALLRARAFDEAFDEATEAIRLEPGDAQAWLLRGQARRGNGDPNGAIADFTEAIRLSPNSAVAFNGRGTARYDKGEMDEAIEDFTEAIRLNPDFAWAICNRGLARERNGEVDQAIEDFTEAIRIDSNLADAFSFRGEARRGQGDLIGAQEDFAQARHLGL